MRINKLLLNVALGVASAAGISALIFSSFAQRPSDAVNLDVVYFNYLDRPIFDTSIDGKALDSSDPYPATGGSTITGVSLRPGAKRIAWTLGGPEDMPRNGERAVARNSPLLVNVPADAKYLGVHIRSDETVELIPTRHYPRASDRRVADMKSRNDR